MKQRNHTSSRSMLAAGVLAAVVLVACVSAFAVPSAPMSVHQAWVVKAERLDATTPGLPDSSVNARDDTLAVPNPVGEPVVSRAQVLPSEPFGKAPAPARAPPVPLRQIV